MREVHVSQITDAVYHLCQEANFVLGGDVKKALKRAMDLEQSPLGQEILTQIVENYKIAEDEKVPMCQDTGFSLVFIKLGIDVHLTGGDLYEAVNEGIRRGFTDGFLRKSIYANPIKRDRNTGDNTPAQVYLQLVPGDKIEIDYDSKGGGSENMSRLAMLKPADGLEGVKKFVLETVANAGPNACPPMIVGVGVGGTFDRCAYLAKYSLLREVGDPNPDPELAALEEELLTEVNKLGVGPQGLGGTVTAMAVHIEMHPCHIASLPVAVNIECHSHRHKHVIL